MLIYFHIKTSQNQDNKLITSQHSLKAKHPNKLFSFVTYLQKFFL